MKKVLAILSIVALASCGNGATSNEAGSDSTNVVDSTKKDSSVVVPLVDSVELGGPQSTSTEVK